MRASLRSQSLPAPPTPAEPAETSASAATEATLAATEAAPAAIEVPEADPPAAGPEARDEADLSDEAEARGEPAEQTPPDPEPVTSSAAGTESTPAEPPSATLDPQMEVTVVPGVPRYHTSSCILIRFMGEEDLERMTVAAARDSGCTPCRACQPDQPDHPSSN